MYESPSRRHLRSSCVLFAAATLAAAAREAPTPIGTQPFADHRNPPSYRKLSDAESARYELGMAVFNTQFVVAGTPNAGRRDGVGPLFNSASCDACHNNGAHGRARSVEEAILWHDGEAVGARKKFEHLTATERKAFLHWVETL